MIKDTWSVDGKILVKDNQDQVHVVNTMAAFMEFCSLHCYPGTMDVLGRLELQARDRRLEIESRQAPKDKLIIYAESEAAKKSEQNPSRSTRFNHSSGFRSTTRKQPKSNNTKFIVETRQQSVEILGISFILLVLQILLILGSIETNPGPSDYEASPESSINSKDLSNFYDLFSKSLSFLHLKIQSLAPKIDLIAAEYEEFDILAFTESWLNSSHTDDSINLLNIHSPFRRDRGPQKLGGEVVVYVKNNLNVRRRPDLEIDELEAIWLELKVQNKNIVFGTFYIPPNSGHETWDKVETSLDMALNDNKDNIIVSGDFNENQLNISNSKVKALLNQFSLTQMIDEPTHFTENSTSLIDLIMTSNVNEISYCCVGPPLTDQIRYHCPVIGFLNFLKTPLKAFKRKIWLYDEGDYDLFRNTRSEADWDTIIASDSEDEVTENITNTILPAAAISIPNKIITVRKSSPVWLKNDVKK
ncbi:unnamed protein product [Mytilus coruscus]|uniref:Endonuclease/exonuclease/phosphatase domain-containing protein n=1 Tax=Mytilus coruscus TaxID=42192 RepID=A0A6J8D284_MYTCO|nr:unnamed protein product [Mytilus coruscus]